MLAEGKAMKKGVDGVETMLPAEEFVTELRKRDFVVNESLIYLQQKTRSSGPGQSQSALP